MFSEKPNGNEKEAVESFVTLKVPGRLLALHSDELVDASGNIRKLPQGGYGPNGAEHVIRLQGNGGVEFPVKEIDGQWKITNPGYWMVNGKWSTPNTRAEEAQIAKSD